MPTAYCYTRVSTDRQAKEGTSLESQQQRMRDYCATKGLGEPVFFSDPAVSSKVWFAKREAGGELIDRIRRDDHFVITYIDRAFRTMGDFYATFEMLKDRGINFHILQFQGNEIDARTPVGSLVFGILAIVANMERDIKSGRAKDVWNYYRRIKRLYRHNSVRYGFKTVPAPDRGYVTVPDPVQREMMGRMLEWRLQGKSIGWIRQHLDYTLREKPCFGTQTQWNDGTILKIIRSEIELRKAEGREVPV